MLADNAFDRIYSGGAAMSLTLLVAHSNDPRDTKK
jgi:hypothetical protein